MGTTRGAFRGGGGGRGRGGRPTPKPAFAQYSDLTISDEKNEQYCANTEIIPFNIVSPDILRIKEERAQNVH